MASLRDMVTGSDACAPDGAGPSNAVASLADALLGGRGKQEQQLHELPGMGAAGPSHISAPFRSHTAAEAAEAALYGDLPAVPGMGPSSAANADVETFLRSKGAQGQYHGGFNAGLMNEFDDIYAAAAGRSAGHLGQQGHMPSPSQLSSPGRAAIQPVLQAFFHTDGRQASQLALPPGMELSVPDKCRVRDRSTILARQVFADRGSAFADHQVGRLLHSLNIDPSSLPGGLVGGDTTAWEQIYQSSSGHAGHAVAGDHAASAAMAHAAGPSAWVNEFNGLRLNNNESEAVAAVEAVPLPPGSWAEEYTSAREGREASSSWADEFRTAADAGVAIRQRSEPGAALEQTKRLAETLAANKDPKFQNSQFLQFVSKMSRGELIMENNSVREAPAASAAWAQEFGARVNEAGNARQGVSEGGPTAWGDEFASFQASRQAGGAPVAATSEDWAGQFAEQLTDGGAWANEFSESGAVAASGWEEEYLAELERLHSSTGPRASGDYIMAENNPFLTDTDSFSKGKDLFQRGVLSEAVLALEAECQRNPGNAEAWRLLGTVQAENDDDVQAIAALNRAVAADPGDLDAQLSLGVSHTNELEQELALSHLREWVMKHPRHGEQARRTPGPPDSSQAMLYVTGLYEAAAAAAPQDADVHAALGVLRNLARHHDGAIAAFRAALALRPQDYSLWNKLGATLANSGRSGEALQAYQKALELKPNYMRAWTNMGISLANLGEYEDSARYYVRALALNRRAAAVWGYLRTSLSCAAREDLMALATDENLEGLQAALPL